MNKKIRDILDSVVGLLLLFTIFIIFLFISIGLLISIIAFGIMNPGELKKITKSFIGDHE